jgi:1,4-dihydroxy-2-naphthoyl-CoA hydrolase
MIKNVLEMIAKNQEHSVFHALGITIDKVDPDESIVSLTVDDRHFQHAGLVHGGIYVLMAETVASIAGACTLTDENLRVVGLEINANHLRSATCGFLSARSKLLHKGSRTLVYSNQVENEKGQIMSISRCTLMIVPRKH